MEINNILLKYGFSNVTLAPLGNGLINTTWKFEYEGNNYIIQRINNKIFKQPENIDDNLREIGYFLKQHFPNYFLPLPLADIEGNTINGSEKEGYYRLFDYVENTLVFQSVFNPELAFQASMKFGEFTRLLKDFDKQRLKITIPDFHNIRLRYSQFLTAVRSADQQRLLHSKELIQKLDGYAYIINTYETSLMNGSYKLRVMHHDTKISNVLFNNVSEAVCIIDLDTIMPGYFVSDVGDMIRTYISAANEEETDVAKIDIRREYLSAIKEGYLYHMKDELTNEERSSFIYAGTFMIYMQALRFLTDFLNNDIYYGSRYDNHNFNRAKNQLVLLEKLLQSGMQM